jgi:heme A synthase
MRKSMSFGTGLLLGVIVTGTWFMTQTAANSPATIPPTAISTMNPAEMMLNAKDMPVQDPVDAF